MSDRVFLSAVIVAAGKSTRMGGENKQLLLIDNKPVLLHTLLAFESCDSIDEIILVANSTMLATYSDIANKNNISKLKAIVCGGNSRQESVFAGIAATLGEYVCIHDGARPLVDTLIIERVLQSAIKHKSATAAVKVKDTIKRAKDNIVCETLNRDELYIIQTPQIFISSLYKTAMQTAIKFGGDYTDDCQLLEAIGEKVFLSEGSYSNIKITTPEDLAVANALYKSKREGSK